LLMLDPELAEEKQAEIVDRVKELVERSGGTWGGQEPWGRRKLAYEIDHKGEGVYYLLTFDSEPETLDELVRILKIDDNVMRHLAVRRIEGSHRGAPPPVDTVVQPEYAGSNTRSLDEEE
jgi:small subunit ribosomal protein S6